MRAGRQTSRQTNTEDRQAAVVTETGRQTEKESHDCFCLKHYTQEQKEKKTYCYWLGLEPSVPYLSAQFVIQIVVLTLSLPFANRIASLALLVS